MDYKHKNHLVSGYVTLLKEIREIKSVVREGEPISGMGTMMEPLSEKEQKIIFSILSLIAASLRDLIIQFAPEKLQDLEKRRDTSMTRMWTSILLGNIRETLKSIHPKNSERSFGNMLPDEREKIATEIEMALEKIEQLLKEI